MVAGIPEWPEMREVFVPSDEIMVIFTAQRMWQIVPGLRVPNRQPRLTATSGRRCHRHDKTSAGEQVNLFGTAQVDRSSAALPYLSEKMPARSRLGMRGSARSGSGALSASVLGELHQPVWTATVDLRARPGVN
jgi:hypothetical protein